MSKVIHRIPNGNGEIQITESQYKGKTFIDVRKYFSTQDSDEMIPTKKGIAINPDNLIEVIAGLEKAKKILGIKKKGVKK